jgi:hypothetical protein
MLDILLRMKRVYSKKSKLFVGGGTYFMHGARNIKIIGVRIRITGREALIFINRKNLSYKVPWG